MKLRGFVIAAGLLALAALAQEPGAPVRIFPSAEVLPANHLKFYLHFPEPMRQGVFLAHCALLEERGGVVREPFRETELWSDDRRRLTLWLHPGRQKTGVNLNSEFGPVLEPDRRYTLRISGRWPTERGPNLGADVEKTFRTGARVTAQLDTTRWTIVAPPAGTMLPLEIRFPAPLDHALLVRCLRVVDAALASVAGDLRIPPGEQAWLFTPRLPWSAAEYHLLSEAVLEDLAGNSLARPFEVDLTAPSPRRIPPVLDLPFRATAPAR